MCFSGVSHSCSIIFTLRVTAKLHKHQVIPYPLASEHNKQTSENTEGTIKN